MGNNLNGKSGLNRGILEGGGIRWRKRGGISVDVKIIWAFVNELTA
jgi:hypothetical protein